MLYNIIYKLYNQSYKQGNPEIVDPINNNTNMYLVAMGTPGDGRVSTRNAARLAHRTRNAHGNTDLVNFLLPSPSDDDMTRACMAIERTKARIKM